jgi:HAD-hyrolase-like
MPLTLEQYAEHLENRSDLPMPEPPEIDAPRAKPHLVRLPGVRAVLWNVYGTLLQISEGELKFEHPNDFITNIALDKTIQEFKMWNSMSRKPGQPADYMREIYNRELTALRLAPSGSEKFPEIQAERIWESIIKKLFQKDYKFDVGFYGALNEYSRKVAYFYHASLQGTCAYPRASEAMEQLASLGILQGLLGDGQVFTTAQLSRGLRRQNPSCELNALIPDSLRILSAPHKARKPSETLFRAALEILQERGIRAKEILHIGSSLTRDIAPARRLGMMTGLFAGDKNSLSATPDQLKDPQSRPDIMITELSQIPAVFSGT